MIVTSPVPTPIRHGVSLYQLLLTLILLLAFLFSLVAYAPSNFSADDGIETYTLSSFPNQRKIALHFPCAESDVFPTKCMCHIRCAGKDCLNARGICVKYRALGCQYLIMRGGRASRFATLKRRPTSQERDR
ncbi:hypothetical protein EON64_10540 [archaeon]|nr:MAG: hypothetical protein EON64_10540 [archaeon]